MKNVKCARCVRCGKEYEAVPNLTNCSCGGILDIVYDYDYIKAHFTKETLKNRDEHRPCGATASCCRWRSTTPDTPLRVGWSPLYEEPKLAEMLGLGPSVGQGRRHQPDGFSEGPRLRHGRRQGA